MIRQVHFRTKAEDIRVLVQTDAAIGIVLQLRGFIGEAVCSSAEVWLNFEEASRLAAALRDLAADPEHPPSDPLT